MEFQQFIASSSDFAAAFGGLWSQVYDFMKPLVDAADGLVKLLKLLP